MSVDPELRRKAKSALHKALYAGTIVRPQLCESCGKPPAKGVLDGHHHRGYDDAHLLDVVWLCRSCHQLVHPRRLGLPHPEADKQKISDGLRRAYEEGRRQRPDLNGKKNPFYGKTHSPEARRKMSDARRRRTQ
jgi:NUMOD3 motif-containing protein